MRDAEQPSVAISDDEYRVITQTAERLCVEFARLLDRFGKNKASPRALSRMLDVNFRLCQQLTAALRQGPSDPAQFFQKLPGPQGLRNVLDGIVRVSSLTLHRNSPALQAMNDFEQLLLAHGGSLASLQRQLERSERATDLSNPVSQEYSLAKRRSVQKLMTEILGGGSDLMYGLNIVKPIADDTRFVEIVSASAIVGFESIVGRGRLIQNLWKTGGGAADLTAEVRVLALGGDNEDCPGLISEFSSPNLSGASVEAVDGQARAVVYAPLGEKVNVAFAYKSSPHENDSQSGCLSTVYHCRRSTRLLIFDTYLHRDFVRLTKPSVSVDAFYWNPSFVHDPRRNRDDRLPLRPQLEPLGEGVICASSSAWSRLADLVSHIFRAADWRAEEFEGYRCEEAAPLCGSMYEMSFDFRQ